MTARRRRWPASAPMAPVWSSPTSAASPRAALCPLSSCPPPRVSTGWSSCRRPPRPCPARLRHGTYLRLGRGAAARRQHPCASRDECTQDVQGRESGRQQGRDCHDYDRPGGHGPAALTPGKPATAPLTGVAGPTAALPASTSATTAPAAVAVAGGAPAAVAPLVSDAAPVSTIQTAAAIIPNDQRTRLLALAGLLLLLTYVGLMMATDRQREPKAAADVWGFGRYKSARSGQAPSSRDQK